MRLVDADKILEKLETGLDNPEEFPVMGLGAIMRLINNEPEVQSAQPEIIHCGDCLFREIFGNDYYCDHITGEEIMVQKNDFCSWGERRTDGSD